jgi:hypothetical protein
MAADDGHPPLFRSWRGLYSFVIGALVVEIILLSLISWGYR